MASTTHISVKAPEPPKYNGDTSRLDTWLFSLQMYFNAVGWRYADPADT